MNDLCGLNTYDIEKGSSIQLGKDEGKNTFASINVNCYDDNNGCF